MNNLNKSEKKRYSLASAVSRTLTRLFDLILVLLILVALFFAIFHTWLSYDFSKANGLSSWNAVESWRLFLFTLVIFLAFFSYFVFLPFFTQGYTLFSKLFKIRIYSTSLKIINDKRKIFKNLHFLFLVQLIVRETLSTILISFVIFVLGIVALFDKKDVISFLWHTVNGRIESDGTNAVSIIFQSLFTCIALVNIVLIVNVAFTSKRRSFTDIFSNTVVVKMIETYSDEKKNNLNYKDQTKPIVKYNLPGEFDPSEIFEKENREK